MTLLLILGKIVAEGISTQEDRLLIPCHIFSFILLLLLFMTLRPLGNRVIVKPDAKEEMTKAGIILPDTANTERPERGEVIAIGPGRMLDNGTREAMSIKVGDKIVFKKYSPDEVKVGNEEFLVIAETDIMAVLES